MALENIKRATNKNTRQKRFKTPARRSSSNGFKLVTRPQVRAHVDKIVEELDPEKVILFGSYAYGKPSTDSDVDMLIVMESEERPVKRIVRVLNTIRGTKSFPMDILVRTPEEIADRLRIGDFFLAEIWSLARSSMHVGALGNWELIC